MLFIIVTFTLMLLFVSTQANPQAKPVVAETRPLLALFVISSVMEYDESSVEMYPTNPET